MFKVKKEDRSEIEVALKETLKSINDLRILRIDNKTYTIKPLISGDMKFLSIIYGINGANADYPCVLCICPQDDFHKPNRTRERRTIKQAKEKCMLKGTAKRLGYVFEPLIDLEFDCIVLDFGLHLFLRITDALLELLMKDLFAVDKSDKFDLKNREYLRIFNNFLEEDCNINSPFYGDDKKGVQLRSLNGNERNTICEKIKFSKLFPKIENANLKDLLWDHFFSTFVYIKEMFTDEKNGEIDKYFTINNAENVEKKETPTFEENVATLEVYLSKFWLNLFVKSYKPKNITPYIHAFVDHVPESIRLFKDLNSFNLQGLEKLNHITIISFQRSTNKHLTQNKKCFVKQLIEKMNRREFFLLGEKITK